MRRIVVCISVTAMAALAGACRDTAQEARRNPNAPSISGTVVETLDSPPYSFLRISTGEGEVWAAVPIKRIPTNKTITIVNGVPVKRFEAKRLGKKFDLVVFGTVE